MIVDLKSMEHPLWGDGGGDVSQCICVDTHDSVFPKWSRGRCKQGKMKGLQT